METVLESKISVKRPPKQKPNLEPVGALNREAQIILRIDLSGTISTAIIADESEAEERMHEALATIRPILERLCEVMSVRLLEGYSAR